MTFAQNPVATFVKQPQNGKVIANTTTNTNIYTAGANGSKIISLVATTNATAQVNAAIQILNSSTLYTLGYIGIPPNAGTNTSVNSYNILSGGTIPGLPVDSDGNPFIFLISGDSLQVSLVAAITGSNAATFFVFGGDF